MTNPLFPLVIAILSLFLLRGYGALLTHFFKVKADYYISSKILIGFVGVSASIEIIQLAFPIDWKITLFISFVGFVSLMYFESINIRKDYEVFCKLFKRHYLLASTIAALIIYWVFRTIKISTNYDTAAYHIQVIRWLNEFAIVPGLGNVHTHLAYNQSYFGFLALLKAFPYFDKGFELGPLIIFLIIGMALIERTKKSFALFIYIPFILYLIAHSAGSTLFSPTPDLVTGFVEIILYIILLDYFFQKNNTVKYKELLPILFLLSCYLFTVKLSAFIFSLALISLILSPLLKHFNNHKTFLIKILFFCFLMVLTHILRGYILSGAPFFPSTFLSINFPWAVPVDIANKDALDIYSVARNPNLPTEMVLGNWDWLSHWVENRFSLANKIYTCIAGALLLLNFYLYSVGRRLKTVHSYIPFMLMPPLASIIFWFLTAPDFRYLGASLEIFIASLFLIFILLLADKNINLLKKIEQMPSLTLTLCLMILFIIPSLNKNLIGKWEDLPATKIEPLRLPSGIIIYKPINGLCWDAMIPCIESADPKLHYLDGQTIQQGFGVKN